MMRDRESRAWKDSGMGVERKEKQGQGTGQKDRRGVAGRLHGWQHGMASSDGSERHCHLLPPLISLQHCMLHGKTCM